MSRDFLLCFFFIQPFSLFFNIFIGCNKLYISNPRSHGFEASRGPIEDDRTPPAGCGRHGIRKPAYLRTWVLPADVIGTTFLFIATRALSITDIVVVSKTVATNDFKGTFRKKADIGGATGMVVAAGSLMVESVGAGEVWCEGGDDGDEAERAMADAGRAGRIGDIGGAGAAGESAVGGAGKVSGSTGGISSIIATECIEQANVNNGGRDGGVVGGRVVGDFKKHTTIFKGFIILKIDCRLLQQPRDM